ncbi:MAG TPA: hypothetical protein PLD23_15135 [Armatimonadota bacterium]|nr:hypothetical protein [Armatimonadota bacterium]HQK94842.1 hypothetical protein [Armatimonadota bacterium]
MTDIEILRPLVDRTLERAALPCQSERAELLARNNALLPVPRAPVIVSFELIPAEHWHLMLGEDHLKCQAEDARALEWRLRRDLWADEHIPHDHPLWPVAWVTADYRQVVGWGVDLGRHAVGGGLTAWGYDPPFRDGIEVSRLTMPEFEHHEAGTRRGPPRHRCPCRKRLGANPQRSGPGRTVRRPSRSHGSSSRCWTGIVGRATRLAAVSPAST